MKTYIEISLVFKYSHPDYILSKGLINNWYNTKSSKMTFFRTSYKNPSKVKTLDDNSLMKRQRKIFLSQLLLLILSIPRSRDNRQLYKLI